jgi:hypothetical protein
MLATNAMTYRTEKTSSHRSQYKHRRVQAPLKNMEPDVLDVVRLPQVEYEYDVDTVEGFEKQVVATGRLSDGKYGGLSI